MTTITNNNICQAIETINENCARDHTGVKGAT